MGKLWLPLLNYFHYLDHGNDGKVISIPSQANYIEKGVVYEDTGVLPQDSPIRTVLAHR